ncbi:MAG: hypothetical protein ACM30I_15085 [Gemmatimonas sp.]
MNPAHVNTAQQIIGVARAAHAAVGEIAALLSYFELGHARAGSTRLAPESAPIAAVVHAAAVERLINAVLRLTDPRRDAAASLAPVFIALSDAATFADVAATGDGARLRSSAERWAALRDNPSLQLIREAWDATQARLLPRYDDVPPDAYDGFVASASEVLLVIADLAAGTGVASGELAPTVTARRAQADAYWTALTRA